MVDSFLEKVIGFFSSRSKKTTPHSRKRSLQIESLETREMLSINGLQPIQDGGTVIHCYNVTADTALQPANDLLDNYSNAVAVLVDGPAHGSLQLLGDGTFTFDPDADYVGSDSFRYNIIGSDDTVYASGRVLLHVVPDIGNILAPQPNGPAIPTEPLGLDFLSENTTTVFIPPVFATGINSATTNSETPTSLEVDELTVLVGTLTQTVAVSVDMQTSAVGWVYSETVTMTYEETYDNATYGGGYTYIFTAWDDGTGTGFMFSSVATDDYTITLNDGGDSLSIFGFTTSGVFLASLSGPDGECFDERYENTATQTTEFQGASGTLYAFEQFTSVVGNTLTMNVQSSGDVETILIGYETVTLEYGGSGQTTSDSPSQTETDALVPNGSSLVLTSYGSLTAFSYAGGESYETSYEIVSIETPVTINNETTYDLLSLTGSCDTTIFSFQEWDDFVTVSYTLVGGGETYVVIAANSQTGDATSDAQWSSELDTAGEWVLLSGGSQVVGSDAATSSSMVAFSTTIVDLEVIDDKIIVRNYAVEATYVDAENEEECYDITETVAAGEWTLTSGTVTSLYQRSTTDDVFVTGTVAITVDNETATWDMRELSQETGWTYVTLTGEVDAFGEWATTGSRDDGASGFNDSYLTLPESTYHRVVDGMTVDGTYGYSEHYRTTYLFQTREIFDGDDWTGATGDGWTLSTAESGVEWSATCYVSRGYGAKASGDDVMEVRRLSEGPLEQDEDEIIVSGMFSEWGFESDESAGAYVEYGLVDDEWVVVFSDENIMSSTRMVLMGYELTATDNGVTVTEKGSVVDMFGVVVGYDPVSGRETWGQANVGYEEYASIEVNYPNGDNNSDTFASSEYVYGAAFVLMEVTDAAEDYGVKQTYTSGVSDMTGPIFALKLEEPVPNQEPELEWKAVYYSATLTTVQKVDRLWTNSVTESSAQNGTSLETTVQATGGMKGGFSFTPVGDLSGGDFSSAANIGVTCNGNANSGDWSAPTQTYKNVDDSDWNVTTTVKSGDTTTKNTKAGKKTVTFFDLGDGTAEEDYDYENKETITTESKTGTTADDNYDIRSYSSSNSIKESYTSYWVDDGFEWYIYSGNGTANGERSWNEKNDTKTTVKSSGGYHEEEDLGSYYSIVNVSTSSSSVTTTSSRGNYQDTWSSTSNYDNLTNEWVLVSGSMSGDGNSRYEYSSQNDSESEFYKLDLMNNGFSQEESSWLELHSSSSQEVDETFNASQTVQNGVWIMSNKSVTIYETSSSESSDEGGQFLSGYYDLEHSYSSSSQFTGTKTFDLSGLVSTNWTIDRSQNTWKVDSYDNVSYSETEFDYNEHVSSSGSASGHYYWGAWGVNYGMHCATYVDVTLGPNGVSGYVERYFDYVLDGRQEVTDNHYDGLFDCYFFQGGGDQSSRGDTVQLSAAGRPADADNPPPKPETPNVEYEKPDLANVNNPLNIPDNLKGELGYDDYRALCDNLEGLKAELKEKMDGLALIRKLSTPVDGAGAIVAWSADAMRIEAKINAIDKVFEFAHGMSDPEKLRFMQVVMTLFEHSEKGNGWGNCMNWARNAHAKILKCKQEATSSEFLFGETSKGVKLHYLWRPLHTYKWVEHGYIEITNKKTGKKIYFDNGGLGVRLFENGPHIPLYGGLAYGGVFFSVPPWLSGSIQK